LVSKGRPEFIGIAFAKPVELLDYIARELTSDILNVSSEARVAGNNISISNADFCDVVPSGDSRFVEITDGTSSNKNQIIAKCGDFAYRIALNIRTPIPPLSDAPTIGRHGDLILRKVHHSNRPVLDLGHCWIGGEKKAKSRFHLMLSFLETSLVVGDEDGGRLIESAEVFVSSNDRQWFQVIGTQ
jgi:hypothetical protein